MNSRELVKGGGLTGMVSFVGYVEGETSTKDELIRSPRVIQLIIKVPSGRLYSESVMIGARFKLNVPSQEFGSVNEVTQIEIGTFLVEATQRAYLISLDRTY
jgi:hypothetical protein